MLDDKQSPSLEGLSSRLKQVQQDRESVGGPRMPPTRLGQSVHLGIEMAATLAVGGGIGWYLDYWLETTPWVLVVFLFLGVGAGISNAFRLAKKYSLELAKRDSLKDGTSVDK